MRRFLAAASALVLALSMAACSHEDSKKDAEAAKCSTVAPSTGADETAGGTVPAANASLARYGAGDGCVYTGPGGFSLDLSKCPANWKNSSGITDKEIKLFTSMPHSGALAAYGAIGDGIESYFDYVNAHGGIFGRSVSLKVEDDQYQPDLTRKNVDAAIQSGEYASSFALLGSAANLNVQHEMNSQCMGQLLTAASDDELFDPAKNPWTSGFGLNYLNESAIWAKSIESQFPQGATVALISIDNALGQSYVRGFKKAVSGTNIRIVSEQKNAVDAPNLNDQVTTAASSKAQVAVLIEAGTFCTQGIGAVEQSPWNPTLITSNSCAQIATTYVPLQQQKLTGNGTQVVRYYYAPTDADVSNPSFAALEISTLKSHGLNPDNAQYANGWFWGWYIVQVLKDASVMKGGLNRANINVAAHSYQSTYPLMAKGVSGRVSGLDDAFPFEAGQVFRYTGATTSKAGHFEPVGAPIDNEGKLGSWSKVSAGK